MYITVFHSCLKGRLPKHLKNTLVRIFEHQPHCMNRGYYVCDVNTTVYLLCLEEQDKRCLLWRAVRGPESRASFNI